MASTDRRSRRSFGLTALFLGFFGAGWLSWAQAAPPLGTWLSVLAWVSLATAAAGAVIGFRSPGGQDQVDGRRYGIIVGVEFAACGLGAVALGATGQSEFIPVWICLVVGVHFFPLAPALHDPLLVPLGVAMCAVAVAGLVVALASSVNASVVVGTGAGLLLAGYAVMALGKAVARP
ncbi:hypothetical protein Rhe02_82410 [Rhizocola hellebori]|uniref:Uncharacterized protein n=1 Tax=Rhizocola hellebori TaxID=1392758 RepID=A0A8J3QI63_9ACTN|nr:hypothetical protein [Rhizocola hellebori]GIH10174.1 hypothetical protein Rhe02_82410 [Rhizocola hellebori]